MKKYILILLALLVLMPADAQRQRGRRKAKKPVVAVVLSGGGAKGVAHISALKVIEEAGIPIDIVCGTSMGALIGGLYSIGWSPQELDSLVRIQDWKFLLSDRVDPDSLTLAQRNRESTYLITHTFGHVGATAKGGMIRGSNLDKLFERLCYGHLDSTDFNSFPIRFACVSTDIVSNTEVDFHSGYLPVAMRASMAIPGVFTPVRMGDSVLADGGMRNNYPADLAKQMGATIIIGVDVQDEDLSADKIHDAMAVFAQIITNNTKNKYKENIKASDIVIRVPVQGYSAASFFPSAIDSLLRRGEEAARSHWDDLIALRRKHHIDSTGRPATLCHPVPHEGRSSFTAHQYFAHTEVGGGFRFDNEEAGVLQIGLLMPYGIKLPMLLDLGLRLGKRIVFKANQQFFPNGWTSPSMSYTFSRNDIDLYTNGVRSFNAKYTQHKVRVSPVNSNFRRYAIEAGVEWDYFSFNQPVLSASTSNLDFTNAHYLSYRLEAILNTENDSYIPTSGQYYRLFAAYRTDNFVTLHDEPGLLDLAATFRSTFPISRIVTLQTGLFGHWLISRHVPLHYHNLAGSQQCIVEQQTPFPGVQSLTPVDNCLTAAYLKMQLQIFKGRYIFIRSALGLQFNALEEIVPEGAETKTIVQNLAPNLFGIQGGYTQNTFLGPVEASIGYSTLAPGLTYYINIGHTF